MKVRGYAAAWMVLIGLTASGLAQTNGDLLKAAQQAVREQKWDEAVSLASKLIAQEPQNKAAYFLRAQIYDAAGKFKEAIADFSKVLALDPKDFRCYHLRGCAAFKAGEIKASISDFERYKELVAQARASHWQCGISYYYAGRYDDGVAQFEMYQKVDNNDVENAIWRFMCMARKEGIPQARERMLKIGPDKRVPMREVYDLFLGKKHPQDVYNAARAGKLEAELLNRQLFYAHLYVGIWHDLNGETEKALKALNEAVRHRIDHYMWDVARVHRDRLAKKSEE